MIIYKATNKINGKVYIGQTIRTLKERIKNHYKDSKYSKALFPNALKKYKREDFEWEIIDRACDIEELNYKEKFWIRFYNSMDKKIGYNLMSGGLNGKHSEETKLKMSK